MIRALQREVSDLETRTGARFQDMMEYYTMWAHQIKTPIASMKVTLQNEDSPLSRRLSTELFHIEQYVDMVLAFLRLDSDSTDYVFREQDLDGIVRQSVVRFAGEFIDRKLSLNCPPLETTVVTDEKWLSFVLEQLLSNALKYTRKGGISISLQPAKTLCIADTGIGIAPEDLPRVFEKGYTGLNGRADKRASGLGLYLCRQICHRLGIELRIECQVGEGTRVFLDLEQYDLRTE